MDDAAPRRDPGAHRELIAARLAPFKTGADRRGIITAVIGVLICPWLILKSAGNYIFIWLVGYGVLLGPIGAIMIIDYFVLRRRSGGVRAKAERPGNAGRVKAGPSSSAETWRLSPRR